MSFLLVAGAAVGIGGGIAKAITGAKARKEARAEKQRAQAEMEAQKEQFANLDVSNPFLGMENVFEDLTVNQMEAQFTREQQQQSQSNILQQMRGAAGGSGIAALAQTMAQQGALDAQRAAVSIGQQEQANQMQTLQEEARLQDKVRQGDIMSRQMKEQQLSTLMGMTAADAEAAARAEQAANAEMWSGISNIGQSFMGGATGLMGNVSGGVEVGKSFWGAGGEGIGATIKDPLDLNN